MSTCFLPSEPSTKSHVVFVLPADTALIGIGATLTPAITVQGDGAWSSSPRVRFESLDTTIVSVDPTGRLLGRRRGVARIHALLVSGASGVGTPDTTFPARVIIDRMALPKNVDCLRALGDTLLFRPGYRDAKGDPLAATDSAEVSPVYRLVSAGQAVQLDAASGTIIAQANGTDTVRATVDTSSITLVVEVRQRAVRVAVTPSPSLGFRALRATQQLSVSAWDRRNNLIPAPVVAWSSDDRTVVAVTDASGLASAVNNGVTAITATVDTVSAAVTAIVSQVPAKLAIAVQPGATAAGSPITPAVQVAVRDSLDNTVTTATDLITVGLRANSGGATLSGTLSRSASGGIATFTDLSLDKLGSGYTLAATASGLTEAISSAFDISAGPASQLVFSVQPSNAIAGTLIAPAVQIRIQDAFGNTVQSAATSVTMAIGTNAGGGTLSGQLTRSAVNGVVTFTDLSLDKAGTGYTLAATANGLAGAISTAFNITAGTPSKLGFRVQPSTTVAGRAITPSVQVAVQDAFGNTVTTASTAVTVAIGTNPTGGVLAGTLTKTAVSGIATFADLSIARAGTGYALSAGATGLTSAASAAFDITPGTAAKLAFTVQPSQTVVSTAITPAVQVAVQDSLGNTVPTATNLITIAIGTNPAGGMLVGTLSRSAVNGVATFTGLSIDRKGSGYTLKATATALAGATSAGFDITAAATRLAFTVQPGLTQAGKPISPAVQVTVQDSAGNVVPTSNAVITITIGANANGATLSGTTIRSAVNGVATFGDLSIDSVRSGYTLTASATGLASAGSVTFDIVANSATKVVFSVQPSTTAAGQSISPAVRVVVQDAFGNTVTAFNGNVSVAITNGTGDPSATLGGATTVPAASGVATFTGLSIDKVGNGYTLAAASSGLVGATSAAFNITPGTAARLSFVAQPSSTTAGARITPALQIAVLDGFGNTVTSFSGSVAVALTAGSGSPNATLLGTTTVSAVAGVATFSTLCVDKAASGYTLTATAAGLAAATSTAFDIVSGLATKLSYSVQPRSAEAGSSLAPPVQVTVRDSLGNVVTTPTTVTLTITSGTGTAGATLSGTRTVSSVGGTASFSDLSIMRAGTDYTLTATASGLTAATSTAFSITPSAAARLVFTGQPSTAQAGSALTPAVRVAVQDAFGNTVTGSGASVTVAIDSGTGTPGARLSGTTTVVASAGIAVLSGLSIDRAGTGYVLAATAAGLARATSAPFAVTVGVPNKLAFTTQPSAAVAGSIMSPSVRVSVQDSVGNPDTTFAGTITIAITSGTGTVGATLSGTLTVTPARGVATFSDLSTDKAGSGYTLTATANGLAGASSTTFTITAGAEAKLAFTVQPTTTAAGATLTPAVRVTAQDALGNTVTTFTGNVTVAVASGTGTAGATLLGTTTVAAVGGVALFSNLSLDKVGSGYALAATAAGVAGATSAAFDVTVGAPAKLAFTVQPSAAAVGSIIMPGVRVAVQDAFGNTVSSSSAVVTIAIGTNPGGATLTGTVSRNAVNGIASFTDLSLDQAGAGYTLTAAASGLVSVTSAQFTITAAAGRLVFSVQPTTTTAGAAMSPAIRVVVQDGSGNVLTSATPPITIAIGTNAGGGTLTGTVSQNAVNGVATFTDLSLDKVGSGYTLTATASGYTGATSAGFGVTPAAPVRLTFTQQPSNTMARAAISPAMLVAIQDAFGNTVTNANAVVNVSLGTNPGGGTLAGTLSTSTVNGVATFSDLSIDKTGIGYTLTAAASGLTSAASAGFRITPGPAAQLVFSAQPSTTAAGVVISPSVQVTIQDAFGNVVTSATTPVMMAIATNPAGGTLSGTVTRNAVNGIATFSDLSIDKVGTGYTLAATASGLPVATSAAFSITPGAVARLTFTAEPSRTPVATTITPAVQVTAQDAFGNTVTSYTGAVSLAITPGTGKANAALGGTLTVSASGGIARFSNLTIDRAGTAYTLTATANGLTADTSAAFDITNPALLRFVVQPTSTTQNSVITPAVQVAVQDAFGNIVRGYTGSVAIALTSSPSGVTLRGTTTVGVVNGIATFSDLSINKTGTGFQLTASDPLGALTAATSVPFDIR